VRKGCASVGGWGATPQHPQRFGRLSGVKLVSIYTRARVGGLGSGFVARLEVWQLIQL
jgi:hypothetical protein